MAQKQGNIPVDQILLIPNSARPQPKRADLKIEQAVA
jgi:hypothetical protein